MELENFKYSINKGPVSLEDLSKSINEGNCRLAIQYYLFKKHNYFLPPEDAICPKLYNHTGLLIPIENQIHFTEKLKEGDIVLAERIKNKKGEPVNRNVDTFKSKDDWIITLHSAIYLGQKAGKQIWHATAIEGRTCYWGMNKFLDYYRPVLAKRIIKK